jgi:hypothetical protein
MKYAVIVTEPAAAAMEENVVWWTRERSVEQELLQEMVM